MVILDKIKIDIQKLTVASSVEGLKKETTLVTENLWLYQLNTRNSRVMYNHSKLTHV
jgi:hypothetical protein